MEDEWLQVVSRCGMLWQVLGECRLRLSATAASQRMGYGSGSALEKELRDRRLPPFRLLRDWVHLVFILEEAETESSLSCWCLGRGEYASIYYRFVVRVTGRPWSEVKALGPAWAKEMALKVWSPYLRPPPNEWQCVLSIMGRALAPPLGPGALR